MRDILPLTLVNGPNMCEILPALLWSQSKYVPFPGHCKSCHLTSITASSCFFCISCPFLFRLIFPVITIPFFSSISCCSPSCLFLSCALFSCLPVVPVPPSYLLSPYRTYLISDNLQCLNDGDVSQLLGNAQGRLSILQKNNLGNMSRSPGLGIRILLIKK
jgi:hypothetical protein